MNEQDKQLDEAYRAFKRRHALPANHKKRVMRAAEGREPSSPTINWARWWQNAATGGALLAIVFFFLASGQHNAPPTPITLVKNVQMHGYTKNDKTQDVANYSQPRNLYLRDYQQQQLAVAVRYSQAATVSDVEGDLALTTCKDELIKISNELVAALQSRKQLPTALMAGDAVTIAFNEKGYIVSVSKPNNTPVCESES